MSFLIKPIAFLFIIFLAYSLKKAGKFKKEHSMIVLSIIMTVTLPATIISAFAGYERDLSLLLIVLVGLLVPIVSYLVMFFLAKNTKKETRIHFTISVTGYNIGCFALPLIQAFYGPVGAIAAIMFDIGNSVMMCSGSYAFTSVLLKTDGENAPVSIGILLKRFFSSIPVDTYLIMFVITTLGVRIPDPVIQFLSPLASANAFLAMFMLGLLFTPPKLFVQWRDTFKVIGFRFLVAAIVSVLIVRFLPFSLEVRHIIILVLFAPIGALAPGFIEQCHGDSESAAFTNSISAIISLIFMTILVGIWN